MNLCYFVPHFNCKKVAIFAAILVFVEIIVNSEIKLVVTDYLHVMAPISNGQYLSCKHITLVGNLT